MSDREDLIKEYVEAGMSYEKIGNILNLSKQRAHQIYSGYNTINPTNSSKLKKRFCEICKTKENLQIHYIDGNTKNNQGHNIATLCIKCHRDLESKLLAIGVRKRKVVGSSIKISKVARVKQQTKREKGLTKDKIVKVRVEDDLWEAIVEAEKKFKISKSEVIRRILISDLLQKENDDK